jgi:hypothetical protein
MAQSSPNMVLEPQTKFDVEQRLVRMIHDAKTQENQSLGGDETMGEYLVCPLCKEDDFDAIGMALHFEDCEKASTIRQDYRIAQAERRSDIGRDRDERNAVK